MADFNIFGSAPEYLTGLLGQQGVEDLQKKALTTGLINAAIGYIAQPKNQRLGGPLPYIGRALQAGMTGAQGVYEQGLKDWQIQQQIADAKRKQEQQASIKELVGGIIDPRERLAAQIAPEQYVASTFKPKAARETTITPNGQLIYKDTGELVTEQSFAAPKEVAPTELDKLIAKRAEIAQKNPNDPALKIYDAKIKKETEPAAGVTVNYGAPVAGYDASGNPVFFQPAKGGGTPSIIPGVTPPPKEEKAPTESQAKAATFYKQMTGASETLNALEKEGYNPAQLSNQISVAAAGTGATGLVNPQAQRARQAQEQWAESFLRIKTGAAATKDEVKRNVETFFPKIGETDPTVIQQKANARKAAEQDVLEMTAPSAAKKLQPVAAPASLKVGDEKSGYVYKGGNPNDPASWIKKGK